MSRIALLPSIAVAAILASTLPATAQTIASTTGAAHETAVPEVAGVRRTAPIAIDGRLDEADWSTAPAATDLKQREPTEGEPATQRTEVRFLFDEDALYVGARMFDDLGAAGVRSRLTRRDGDAEGSDLFTVIFDTYHDHLGGARFSLNPSSVKVDDLSGDQSWDPVWLGSAQIDSLGWTAEMRIPYSQLRYARGAQQTWGLQIDRVVSRLNEVSSWSFWRQNESGGPSRFGHLSGLVITAAPARLEVLPYAVAQATNRAPGDNGDPFYRQREQDYRTGVDVKYLLSSNLTLSATINPDFGQVEVDPAVVNLSAFETFFQEKRPFFVEGQGYFGFGQFWCYFCSNTSSLGLFYSRRIGRVPQGSGLANDESEYAQVPDNTTILAAAKVTGRTKSGWSIAMLDAVGGREEARLVREDGTRGEMIVEPPTNYFVSRVKKDMRDGNLVFGGMATSTVRGLEQGQLADRLTRHAEAVGLDAEAWWKQRTYHFLASVALSQAEGDTSAVRRIQESSARYFQRPDRETGGSGFFTNQFDPTLTSLRGYGFYSRIAKDAGDWLWELAANGRSPGFEVNDIAFLQRTDFVWLNANLQRQWTQPTKYYRRATLMTGAQQQYNWDGDRTDLQGRVFGHIQFPNYWDVSGFVIERPAFLEDRLTRGGPVVRREGFRFFALNVSSDSRKPVSISAHPNMGIHKFGTDVGGVVNLNYRPASNVSLSVGPRYERGITGYQYVTSKDDPTATAFFGKRYVFADVTQRTVAMDTRVNVTFSPTLSLELFAQPFISSGDYGNFKEYDAPRQLGMSSYGSDIGTIQARGEGDDRKFYVDPDGAGPASEFDFEDPDFNFRSLRGNAVLRWEYRPGSTLFLVWAQNRDDTDPFGDLRFNRDRRALFSAAPNNVFLIKMNYWLNR